MLEGKTAVVTGGSRGIGRAVVERLCREGASVVFNYATSDNAADDVVRYVRAGGGKAYAVRSDLNDPTAPQQLMEIAAAYLHGLDILVNNAALPYTPAQLADTDVEVFDSVMAVNARSVFLTMRYAAQQMRFGGRIINISTSMTARPFPNAGVYLASKGAIEQLTAVASQELGTRGITVNTVSPGATNTDLLRQFSTPEDLEALASMSPSGRLGQPADVANVVAFLAGNDGRWITGQNLRATGGGI